MTSPRSAVLLTLLLMLGACSGPHPGGPLEPPLRVLLLGDSISIGYTPFVGEVLGAQAHVVRPTLESGRPENCAGTTNGVKHIARWLAIDGGDWDVIHVNFGLHDLKRVRGDTGKNSNDPDDPRQAAPDVYETQLTRILDAAGATGARVVFATTTPVPAGELRPHRDPADVPAYNLTARRVAREADIPINDLYTFVLDRTEPMLRPGDVHFSPDGSRLLGERVAAAVLEVAGLSSGAVLTR